MYMLIMTMFGFDGDEFCESLERVRDAEIASVVSENIT